MRASKRKVQATAEETLIPPSALSEHQQVARVIKATGNNLYSVELPSKDTLLVELPAKFRSTIWIKRGSYVVIDTEALEDRDDKRGGEIINVVRDEKAWRKADYWPKEFVKQSRFPESSVDEDSTMGKLPPSDDSGS